MKNRRPKPVFFYAGHVCEHVVTKGTHTILNREER